MISDALYSSNTDQWATPQDIFDKLNAEFNFNLDPCADETNHKTARYFTKEQDGLKQYWGGGECFAILHTAGISADGHKKPMRKAKNRTL